MLNPTFCSHSVFIYVVWDSEQSEIVTALTCWFLQQRSNVFTARYELRYLSVIQIISTATAHMSGKY
jgi:ABC-type enterochelin transport system permease subunit